ncbi:MAG TPA: hypothetical protein VEB21_16400 [Terriglobales bacterium]|nr:hypothetical protein [Terriglobales bacterium]
MSENSRSLSAGPLFETPADRVLQRVPRRIVEVFRRCLAADGPVDAAQAVAARLRQIEELAANREFVDITLATRVADRCRELVVRVDPNGADPRAALVRAALRYFLLETDAEPDSAVLGFDDDAAVVAAVASELGFHDLIDAA